MTVDAAAWDERYAGRDAVWSAGPNATVEAVVGDLPTGTVLDVAAGEGRHALWLAARGWRATAVDFSTVGIDRGRRSAAERGVDVEWVVADVTTWTPPTTYDLVLVVYFHAGKAIDALASWVAPGGRLVVLGHALRNLTDGVGGPSRPEVLHTEPLLRRAAGDLDVETLGEVVRPTPDGDAIDLLLVARRPA